MAQRQAMTMMQVFTLRLELVGALHGGPNGNRQYTPTAICPKCARNLTSIEIIKGFRDDTNDFTTGCSGCQTRFDPKLIWRNSAVRVEIPFFCNMQTQAQLAGLESLSPENFEKKHPALYHSAVVHNGTLKAAFERLHITYGFVEIVDPKEKIRPFLGRLPDTVIAEVSGIGINSVRRLRKGLQIAACTQRMMLENAQNN